jgi:hypothetical protein
MKTHNTFLLVVSIFFALATSCLSQSFQVFDIDTTNFPKIKAKFNALDSNNNVISNLTASDFQVIENNQQRKVLSVKCSPAKQQIPVSSVLVMMFHYQCVGVMDLM